MIIHPPALTRVFSELVEEVRTQVTQPPVEGRVDTRFYTDPAWFDKERAALFDGQQPLIVGHTSMLKQAGDHFTHDHTGQPLLVVRGKDDEIRAFLNVCRHRGVRLSNAEGVANAPSFVCPYHNWIYGLDGRLTKVPLQQECFPSLDLSCHGLKQLPLAICEGLILVSPDPDGSIDIERQLGGVPRDFAAFGMADHVFFRESVTERKTNWKLVIEAFLDGYHVVRLHRKSVGPMFLDGVAKSERQGHNIFSVVARQAFSEALDLPEQDWDLRTHVSCAFYIFPNTTIIIHPDYISYLSVFPQGVDSTRMVHGCLIAEEPRDEKAAAHWERAYDIIENGVFQAEDLFVCEQAQIGMTSGANRELLFGSMETSILDFHDILAQKLGTYQAPGVEAAGAEQQASLKLAGHCGE